MEDFQRIQLLGRERDQALRTVEDLEAEIVALVAGARRERYSMEAIARAVGVTRQNLYLWVERSQHSTK